MAMTAAQVLALIAPEVSALANADDWLTLATESVPVIPWGTLRAKGIAYLAAHLAWTSDPTLRGAANSAASVTAGASGVTSRGTGDWSEGYGAGGAAAVAGHSTASLGDKALATTPYGVEFVRLRNSLAARAPFVIQL